MAVLCLSFMITIWAYWNKEVDVFLVTKSYPHNPNQEECVEEEDDDHWELHNPTVKGLLLHDKTLYPHSLVLLLPVPFPLPLPEREVCLSVVLDPQDEPHQGVQHGSSPRNYEEVLVLDGHKREWVLNLQEQVKT